ncbi:MAG TPA: carbonate dehydratase [Curvibacter sp.]|nr:carbonate dehydratase [Curvibacter sp.]
MSDHLQPTPWMSRRATAVASLGLACLLTALPLSAAEPAAKPTAGEALGKDLAEQLREAAKGNLSQKQLTVIVNGTEAKSSGVTSIPKPAKPVAPTRPVGARKTVQAEPADPPAPAVQGSKPAPAASYQRARTAALVGHAAPSATPHKDSHGHDVHWAYEGEGGPDAWGQLKPEYKTCALGKRQSPIHIQESNTLQGPAEAIQFSYQPSSGTVVNNGHTIQVDVVGDNSINVRGSNYKLLQFHFHHPSEEHINHKVYSMVVHLVHRNIEGQLAVVAVLLDPGAANGLINKVWTYMPLDAGDTVRMPAGLLDLNELLPKDQRYYQFLGSLTTPPCTEGVLWLVLKQPTTVSAEQLKLFRQLYPNNARPVQPVNSRPIRDAQ